MHDVGSPRRVQRKKRVVASLAEHTHGLSGSNKIGVIDMLPVMCE